MWLRLLGKESHTPWSWAKHKMILVLPADSDFSDLFFVLHSLVKNMTLMKSTYFGKMMG